MGERERQPKAPRSSRQTRRWITWGAAEKNRPPRYLIADLSDKRFFSSGKILAFRLGFEGEKGLYPRRLLSICDNGSQAAIWHIR